MKTKKRQARLFHIIFILLFAATCLIACEESRESDLGNPIPANRTSGDDYADGTPDLNHALGPDLWKDVVARAAKPYQSYYQSGTIPVHPPTADRIGLEWREPLREEEFGGRDHFDGGGAYCPTMDGREKGPWPDRYQGIHRGHDIGVAAKKLKGARIPVHVVADGVYDGVRTYARFRVRRDEWKSLVVYHHAADGSGRVYTSVYSHVNPRPDLKPGDRLKVGDVLGFLEDPKGLHNAHVHLEVYSDAVYSTRDSTKRSLCGCEKDIECDAMTRRSGSVPGGCGIFEDDIHLLEPLLFIRH